MKMPSFGFYLGNRLRITNIQASTLLFKMDRCELEIGKAARKAREYLDNFQRMDNSGKLDAHGEQDSADKVSGSHPRDCKTGGVGGRRPGGNSSGIKQGGSSRAKDCDKSRSGGVRTVGGWETGGGACKIAKVNNACDHRLERVLGALVRGADTLAASRRDSAASIRSGCRSTGARKKRTSRGRGSGGGEGAGVASNAGSMPQRQGRSSRSGQESVADGGQEGDNSHEDRDSEDSVGSQRDSHASADENIGDGGAFASGFLSGGRRGRKGSRRAARVRSRNTVIDGWLHESDEGHVNGADAFVDLEDFIVG